MNGFMQVYALQCLTSFSCVLVADISFFFLMSVSHCIDASRFIYLFTNWWIFGSFLAIINDASVNVNAQLCVWTCVIISLDLHLGVKWLGICLKS